MQPLCREGPRRPWTVWERQDSSRLACGSARAILLCQAVSLLRTPWVLTCREIWGIIMQNSVPLIQQDWFPRAHLEHVWGADEKWSRIRASLREAPIYVHFSPFGKEVSSICMCRRERSGQGAHPQSNSSSAFGMCLTFHTSWTGSNMVCMIEYGFMSTFICETSISRHLCFNLC